MTLDRNELGIRGETAAALFLERVGMEVVERNWESRYGEVDIIALDEDELVFVEVKTRTSDMKGLPEDAVNQEKQKRYFKLATEYVAAHKEFGKHSLRFDVIGITTLDESHAQLRHHRGAFASD